MVRWVGGNEDEVDEGGKAMIKNKGNTSHTSGGEAWKGESSPPYPNPGPDSTLLVYGVYERGRNGACHHTAPRYPRSSRPGPASRYGYQNKTWHTLAYLTLTRPGSHSLTHSGVTLIAYLLIFMLQGGHTHYHNVRVRVSNSL